MVSHRPFSGCAPPKHTGICLTLAFQEVSGAKNMIKSNMCLRAFLDQSPVTESLPAGREGTAASSPAPAAPFPCSVLPPGRQKRSLNPHIQRNLELQIAQERSSTYCSGGTGKAEAPFWVFWRERKSRIPINVNSLQSQILPLLEKSCHGMG